jgi:hypothetical protein
MPELLLVVPMIQLRLKWKLWVSVVYMW